MGECSVEKLDEEEVGFVEEACRGFRSDRYGPQHFVTGREVRIYLMMGRKDHVLVREGIVRDVHASRPRQRVGLPALGLSVLRAGRLKRDQISWSLDKGVRKYAYCEIGYAKQLDSSKSD
jgi:hypothetical protein